MPYAPEQLPPLTDSECDEFRRLPVSFNDMIRATHQAGAAAILRAQADASPSESLAELLAQADAPTPVGYMHPEDFRDVARGGWVHTVISGKRDSPYMVPLYAPPQAAEPAAPIDMILHCPACGVQHIDAPEPSMLGFDAAMYGGNWPNRWTNPPHRSHLCHGCGHIWRPADVATNGVAAIKTKGKNDSPPAALRQQPATDAELEARTGEPHVDGWPLYSGLPPPAEPGELPPLPEQEHWESKNAWAKRYARLALATSPLPPERVERVIHAMRGVKPAAASITQSERYATAEDAVRAILEGRS